MPFNGSGTFSRLYSWVVDAANNVNISSSRMDAELNGMAAALTNCITRDGQSPPSAATPWGGVRLTNLGAATSGTDALNRDTADARYFLLSSTSLTLSGALNAASLSISGSATVSGQANLNGNTIVGTNALASTISLYLNSAAGQVRTFGFLSGGVYAADISLQADNTTIKHNVTSAHRFDVNGAQTFTITSTGAALVGTLSVSGTATGLTASPGDNSTKFATTAFVVATLGSYAPLASPALTGTPTAPTAAAGTATTQLATTAFVDALRDVPSNAKAANYALALTDRGQGVDFNGTSLTCTIPANASVAFPVGSVIVITNLNSTSLSIAITSDTLTMSGTTTTGTRTLGQNGEARLRKVGATSWLIAGTALS